MAATGRFSQEFLAMTPEQRRERIRGVGLTDDFDLSAEDRAAREQAVQEMTERWVGRLPRPEIVDRRTPKKAG
jgi:hypothetical protein